MDSFAGSRETPFDGVVRRYGIDVVLEVVRGLAVGVSLAQLRRKTGVSKRGLRRIRDAAGRPVQVWRPKAEVAELAAGSPSRVAGKTGGAVPFEIGEMRIGRVNRAKASSSDLAMIARLRRGWSQ